MPKSSPGGTLRTPSRGPIADRKNGPDATGKDARKYPRADVNVKVKLALAGDRTRTFEASLPTTNISVGGMFLESTFFLKLGTLLDVTLELPPHGRTVHARGQVVRIETMSSDASQGHSGFALRFLEYLDGSEVVLATYFLAPILREFIQDYAKQHRLQASNDYVNHTADVLAAWELRKAELGADVWELKAPPPQQRRR
ncbi:MAG: PilZ domain-containing protein [Myxococcaceae bacterium]|nr:PilZ domain-containing protein [Myxococcaceae bacterium]